MSDIDVSIYYQNIMRQNMFNKIVGNDQLQYVVNRKKIISPWNHTKDQYDKRDIDGKAIHFVNICINSNVLINATKTHRILLVKIISHSKWEMCEDMFIIRNNDRECRHAYTTINCEYCKNSIKKIVNCTLIEVEYIKDTTIEHFYSYYRDVEILHDFDKSISNIKHQSPHSICTANNKILSLKYTT